MLGVFVGHKFTASDFWLDLVCDVRSGCLQLHLVKHGTEKRADNIEAILLQHSYSIPARASMTHPFIYISYNSVS